MTPAMRRILESAEPSGKIPIQPIRQDMAVIRLIRAGYIEMPVGQRFFNITAKGKEALQP